MRWTNVVGKALVVVVGFALVPTTALGQSVVSGQVTDNTGGVLPGVTVEAASPALIGGSRLAVSDGQGRYAIIDLEPGLYAVTFRLPGFSTVIREGIDLPANFTATVDVELEVGALEETITVSGASPIVDVQQAQRMEVLDRSVLDSIVTARNTWTQAMLVAGVTMTGADVAGSNYVSDLLLEAHGADATHMTYTVDGMMVDTMLNDGRDQNYYQDQASQEISIQTSGGTAEVSSGGVLLNMIPKDGGNTFSGSGYLGGSNGAWQSDNFSQDLIDQGIQAVDSIDRIFDYGFTQGGPLLRDKLWFFTSWRLWGVWNPVTDTFLDDGTQFRDEDQIWSPVVRFTYQATQRNKITVHFDRQAKSRGPKLTANYPLVLNSAGSDPETARTWQDPGLPYGIAQAKWTSTISSRVLAEAGYSMSRTYVRYRAPFGVHQPRESDLWYERVRKQDLDTGQLWGASFDGLLQPIRHLAHGSVSYVTGSHNFKAGFQNSWGRDTRYQDINGDIDRVRYRSGVPDVVRVRNVPLVTDPRLKYDLGLYAQDAWTLDRLTVNAGIRFELLNSFVNTQSAPAGRFVGVRSFPRTDNVPNWSDVTPRLGLSYDLFGDAKTALKFSVGKYMTPHTTSFAIRFNPMAVATADVPWDDRDLGGLDLATNGDDIPQDNELDLAGRLPANFGERALDRFDPDIEREYNVETALGIQHELVQNVSVSAGWYHRAFHNFYTDDNLLRDFNHYRPVDIVSPLNGEVIPAWDLKDSASLRDVDVLVTNATEGRAQVYNGFELSLNARLPGGGTFIGSTTTQRIVTEHCDDLDDPNNLRFCDRGNLPSDYNSLPWRSDLKLAGSYPLPYDIQVSANFTSMPGRNKGDLVRIDEILPINWNISRGTRYTAAGCAGRPCTAGELVIPDMQLGSLVVPLVPAGTERFLPRQNMLSFGIRKIFQTRSVSYEASFELFNALNANTILAERSANFGTAAYAQPSQILLGRMPRLSVMIRW